MSNVARGVGLGGSATLIFAFMMAAPAVAEPRINVPAIHVETGSSTVGHPASPSFKLGVPQNSKANLGRPSSTKADVLNSQKGGGTATGGVGTIDPNHVEGSSPKLSDPSLRFTLASLAKPHRNQLDDAPPTAPPDPGGCDANCQGIGGVIVGGFTAIGWVAGAVVGTVKQVGSMISQGFSAGYSSTGAK